MMPYLALCWLSALAGKRQGRARTYSVPPLRRAERPFPLLALSGQRVVETSAELILGRGTGRTREALR